MRCLHAASTSCAITVYKRTCKSPRRTFNGKINVPCWVYRAHSDIGGFYMPRRHCIGSYARMLRE